MEKLTVIRKRLIPYEEVDISGDEQLFFDGEALVTRWVPIRPRMDVGWGLSHTSLTEGYKVSAFFDRAGDFKYWYWDIIDTVFCRKKQKLVVRDLLVDVVVDAAFEIEILDREELSQALEQGLISETEALYAEGMTQRILEKVAEGDFPFFDAPRQEYEPPPGFVPFFIEKMNSL